MNRDCNAKYKNKGRADVQVDHGPCGRDEGDNLEPILEAMARTGVDVRRSQARSSLCRRKSVIGS